MADTKKVSELSTAAQLENSDLLMVSQGSQGSGWASLKTNILTLAQKIATGINFSSDLRTTNKTLVGAINEAAESGGTDIIAEEFDSTQTYAVGDYVTHEGSLYKCTTAVTVAGAWNSSDWTETLVMDEVSAGGGSSTLAGLTDVDLDNLADGQILVWDDTNSKWVNADNQGGSGREIFSGKALVMKTKTWTGDGSNPCVLTFTEKPFAIFNIYGDGLGGSKVLNSPFMYGETNYFISSYSSGLLFNTVSYSNNDLTMTMSGVDEGAVFNASGSQYTMWYLVEETFNAFKEITGVLEAGETEITLEDSCIKGNSTIEPFTSKFGLSPTDMVVGESNYTYSSFMDDKIVIRENEDDSTDIKLFICGLTKESSSLTITDNDLLAYFSDITSGYLKACETFDTADSTTPTGILAITNSSGTYSIATFIPGWSQYKAGTFYGVIDLNESPVVAQGAPEYQENEYSDPYDVGGSVTLTFPVQSSNVNVKVRVS